MGLDEQDLETIYGNIKMLENGKLPDANLPNNFPRPTLIRIEGIPMQRDCTLL